MKTILATGLIALSRRGMDLMEFARQDDKLDPGQIVAASGAKATTTDFGVVRIAGPGRTSRGAWT
jgi:hypothetical protein